MSRLLSVFCFVLVLLSAPEIGLAQEKVTFGIGLSFHPAALAGDRSSLFQTDGVADLYLPVQIGSILRAELQTAYFSRSSDQTVADSVGALNEHQSESFFRIGFGIFYTWHPDSTLLLYTGPRTGILTSTNYIAYSRAAKGFSDGESNWAAFFIKACFGAEYALSRHFSIGGELQLSSTGFGTPIVDPEPKSYPRDYQQQVYSTDAIVLARYFF